MAGGVVAGLLILGSILLTGGVALPIWLAVFGAILFGGLYQLSGPKAGLQGWLEAFGLAGMGAIAVPLLAQGISAMAALGSVGILKLFVSKGIVGGVSSAISYIILTPSNEWSIQGLAIAFGAGVLTEMLAAPSAKAAWAAILGTIEAARRKELSWATPIQSFGQSLFLDQPGSKVYNKHFGRGIGKGIGWLRGKGFSISPLGFAMRVLNRVSWDVIKNKLFGM